MNMKYAFIFFIFVFVTSCNTQPKLKNQHLITVTIEPYRYFVEKIVGNRYHVQTIVPKGSNPETYEPTTRQMMQLSESTLYIEVGNLGFERSWMKRLKENAPNAVIIDSSKGIITKKSSEKHYDPHVWMSIYNAKIIAKNIYEAVMSVDKVDSIYYTTNYRKFIDELQKLNRIVSQNVKPITGSSFIIYHPMLTYFADEFSLNQIPLEHEGSEPSAAQLTRIIEKSKKENVRVILLQKEFNSRNIEIVAKSLNIPVRNINPLGYEWYDNMIDISQKLR